MGILAERGVVGSLKWGTSLSNSFSKGVEAGALAKYFLAQSVGTGFFLIFPLSSVAYPLFGFYSSCVFLACGLLLKGGVAPFHQ